MRLIGLAVILAVSLTLAPRAAEAQPAGKVYRIGLLSEFPQPPPEADSFTMGLREHGYVIGRNLVLEFRWSQGQSGGLGALAAELVRMPVDVLVTVGNSSTAAAKQATTSIPIVMMLPVSPERAGFIASLARPGGNITGLTSDVTPEIWGKRLEILKEIAPRVTHVGVVWSPTTWGGQADYWNEMDLVTKRLRIALQSFELREASDLSRAFTEIRTKRIDGLFIPGDPVSFTQLGAVMTFTAQNQLPVIYGARFGVDAGGLVSYGPNVSDLLRRAAGYVHKILNGARPSELPVERPAKLEFLINLKTAKALGLTIPESLLVRADEIIQ